MTIATAYNGKEVAENYLKFTTRPIRPAGLHVRWGFDVTNNTVFYKADLTWMGVGGADDKDSISYFVEVEEGATTLAHEVSIVQLVLFV